MMKQTLLVLLVIAAIVTPAMGLGIQKADLGDIQQGSTKTISIYLYTASKESTNYFTQKLTLPDEIKEWVTVTPATNIVLGYGKMQKITVTVKVPKDATLGVKTGEIKYSGSKVMGNGGQIGYTVATKSKLLFKVVKS